MSIARIFRILNANLILALPFIIGINCNLAVDCSVEKTAVNSPFCEVPLPTLLWLGSIAWVWIFIRIFNKKKQISLWVLLIPTVILATLAFAIFLNHRI
tara:strand:- start:469 stop:765 length:297 start_codon:yes stop_codon:yes gene_type:complete